MDNKKRKLGALIHKCSRDFYFHSNWGMRQTEVLKMLKDGPMSQKEIGERLGIQAAAVSELIAKLEDKGQITKERSEADKRFVLIALTERGRFDLKKREEMPAFKLEKFPLSDEETDELFFLLEKLENAFEEEASKAKEKEGEV